MTRMIVRVAVMWQISVALHTEEGKRTDFVMRQEGKRHSPVTFLWLSLGARLAGQRHWQYCPLSPRSHSQSGAMGNGLGNQSVQKLSGKKVIWMRLRIHQQAGAGGKCFGYCYCARYVPTAITSKRSCAGKRQGFIWISQCDWTTAARKIKNPIMKSLAHFSF